jgi:DNA topoisomerase-1
MKKLFIVESPGKAKTIKKYLGNDFIVLSTMGHIKDLPQKNLGIEITPPDEIKIDYEAMPGKEKTIKEIKKYESEVDVIYLAPDADREGEIIALHIKEIFDSKKKQTKEIYRVTYNEISQKAILQSIKDKRELDYKMIGAQQARRILDRLVGYKVSPVLWKKLSKGLSAGRVQSVALKLICLREEEINAFIITEYWTIHGNALYENHHIAADIEPVNKKTKKDISGEDAKKILNSIEKKGWKITEIKEKQKQRKPYPPFTTSSLQQAAYNILHFNVQQTMMIAQQLYEGISIDKDNAVALITYMRTDSTRIAEEAIKKARLYISDTFGDTYIPKKAHQYTQKNKTQDAHEAIRPIDVTITPQSVEKILTKEQFNLYTLIWNRYVACQMSEALYNSRSISLIDPSEKYTGKIAGSHILFDGFLKVYNTSEDESDEAESTKLPPKMEKGTIINFDEFKSKQHFTQPPARYSEATLVKELEQKGIGRPSTFVPILKTIRDRLYTELDSKKRFVPTTLGKQVYTLLEENITKIMDLSFTADMEKKLDEIAQGDTTRNKVVFDFYDYLIPTVKAFAEKKIEKKYEESSLSCGSQECSGTLVVKWSKAGEFLGCNQFPECKHTANFSRGEKNKIIIEEKQTKKPEEKELLDIECIKCGKQMTKKIGRYGSFIACSGYPQCTYIKNETTTSLCPQCNTKPLQKKMWKGKSFWGCSNYPDCKFSINGDIIEKTCSVCTYRFFKKISDGDQCANKECKGNT